jgi:hypothetical protein
VTIKMWGVGLVTEFIGLLQFLITIQSGTIANSHSLKFTIAHIESSWSAVSSPVIWYYLPTVVVPLPLGSRIILVPEQLLTHSKLVSNSNNGTPLVLF